MTHTNKFVYWFKELNIKDVSQVGGKNASLGEMYQKLISKGVRVPNGFATTAEAYQYFLKQSGLADEIKTTLHGLDVTNIKELMKRGEKIRQMILKADLPLELEKQIRQAYQKLAQEYKNKKVDVAVRSSATAEDLPTASFAL